MGNRLMTVFEFIYKRECVEDIKNRNTERTPPERKKRTKAKIK